MTKVRKGGREYSVPDEEVDAYLAAGYSVIDARGNTLKTGTSAKYEDLIVENRTLRQTVKRMEQSMETLTARLKEKEEAVKRLTDDLESEKSEEKGGK